MHLTSITKPMKVTPQYSFESPSDHVQEIVTPKVPKSSRDRKSAQR